MTKSAAKSKSGVVCVVALLAVSAYFFSPALFQGKAFVPADLLGYISPWKQAAGGARHFNNNAISDGVFQYYTDKALLSRELGRGNVPLWNPYSFCGQPFVANNKSAVFYPLNAVIFRLMPPWRAMGFSAALHMFLAGLFMYMFLRLWKLRPEACAVGAAAYMLNGWFVSYMQITSLFHAGVWAPLILCLYEISVRKGRARYAALAGAALGIQLTAGFLQVSAYAAVMLFAYAAWRSAALWIEKKNAAAALAPVFFAAVAVAAGAGIAAVQLLPVAELLPHSNRVRATLAKASGSGVAPWQLVNFFSPDFVGNPSRHRLFFQAGAYLEWNACTGVCALFLAAAGLVSRRRGPALFFAAAGVAALLMAMGSPVYALFHTFFPGGGMLRANRFLYLLPLCVSVAAAVGADVFIGGTSSRPTPDKWRVNRVAAACATVAALAALSFHSAAAAIMSATNIPPEILWWDERRALTVFAAFSSAAIAVFLLRKFIPRPARAALLAALVAADLILWGRGFNTYVQPEKVFPAVKAIQFLQSRAASEQPFRIHSYDFNTLSPNSSIVFGLEDIRGYDSIYPERYARLINALAPAPVTSGSGDTNSVVNTAVIVSPLINFMNARYIPAPDFIRHPQFRLVDQSNIPIFENTAALPRAFVVNRWRVMDDSAAVPFLASRNFEPDNEVVLPIAPGIAATENAVFIPAETNYPKTGEVEIKFEKRGGPALLVLSDQWDPGWTATLDNRHVQLLRANVAFRAVAVPSNGKHIVKMKYSPRSVRAGFAISMLSLAFAFTFGLLPFARKTSRPKS